MLSSAFAVFENRADPAGLPLLSQLLRDDYFWQKAFRSGSGIRGVVCEGNKPILLFMYAYPTALESILNTEFSRFGATLERLDAHQLVDGLAALRRDWFHRLDKAMAANCCQSGTLPLSGAVSSNTQWYSSISVLSVRSAAALDSPTIGEIGQGVVFQIGKS